jgi:hypothetical protein
VDDIEDDTQQLLLLDDVLEEAENIDLKEDDDEVSLSVSWRYRQP